MRWWKYHRLNPYPRRLILRKNPVKPQKKYIPPMNPPGGNLPSVSLPIHSPTDENKAHKNGANVSIFLGHFQKRLTAEQNRFRFRPGFCSIGLSHCSQTDAAFFAARLCRLQNDFTMLMEIWICAAILPYPAPSRRMAMICCFCSSVMMDTS